MKLVIEIKTTKMLKLQMPGGGKEGRKRSRELICLIFYLIGTHVTTEK